MMEMILMILARAEAPSSSSKTQPQATPHTKPQIARFDGMASIPSPPVTALGWPKPPPYNNTVKELEGAAVASPAACEAACISYRNEKVSPVSGWTRCAAYTHVAAGAGRGARCVVLVDADEWAPQPMRGAVAGRLTWPPRRCATAADCSFNGVCDGARARCACDAAWTGERCQTLALVPARAGAGLRLLDGAGRNVSTWGGSVLLDAARDPPTYHMWASEITHGCGIDAWRTNSQIVHATSADGVHFKRREVVQGVFAHEPTVARAPDGRWVMWYTGEFAGRAPPPPCRACAGGRTPANTSCYTGFGGGPTYMSWAAAPDGPWSPPQRLFAAQAHATNMDTNLAATILPNGSVVGIARTGGAPTGILAHLVTASDWRDTSSYVGRWTQLLFPNTSVVDFAGVEDPYVWRDARTGVLHAVFHSQIEGDDERLCGAHAFSKDGVAWAFGGTAWSNRVRFADGADYRFSRRERPHLVLGANGTIEALTTAVQYGAHAPVYVAGEDASYTLLQPVRRG